MRKTKRGMFEKDKNDFDSVVQTKKKSKRISKILAVLIVVAAAVLGFYMCSEKLLIIKNIEVVNSETGEITQLPYTEDELMSFLGISKGMKLYEHSASEMEMSAKYSLTYVKNLDVSRRWPSTVVLNVIPESPLYYVTIENNMYILSDELKVIDVTGDVELVETNKLKLLRVASINQCIKGEKILIDKDIEEIILNITSVLETENCLSDVTMINVTDKFGIELMYDTKYIVKLGDSKDLSNKIKMMNAIIKDKSEKIVSGTIDVTKDYGKTGTFKKFS